MRWTAALAVAFVACAGTARADEVQAAREAYLAGQAAHERGDYLEAARSFARADELAARDVALQAALEAVVLTDDALLAMELAARAKRVASPPKDLEEAVTAARAKFSSKVGTARLSCADRTQPCAGSLEDGKALGTEPRLLLAGEHTATLGKRTFRFVVEGDKESTVPVPALGLDPVPPVASAPAVTEERKHRGGLSVVWPIAVGVVAAGFTGATVASFVDTASIHDRFVTAQCGQVYAPGCDALAESGKSAETRTVVLGVIAAVALAATATLAVLAALGGTASP